MKRKHFFNRKTGRMKRLIFLTILMYFMASFATQGAVIKFSYSDNNWDKSNFTFRIAAREDLGKAHLKNIARITATIRELYGDSLLLKAYKNAYIDKGNGERALICFTFSMQNGKLREITFIASEIRYGPLCKFVTSHFEEIMQHFVKKYNEIYITLPDEEYNYYARHHDAGENIYEFYFRQSKINPHRSSTWQNEMLLLPRVVYGLPEFKSEKEVLDYILTFENCPIKTNVEAGVLREDYFE